ncbi:MAG: hypothetical protein HYX84_02600 [Chloroflexi bacterium]|nr:hypothetical protein [Chloroflexota bacterium]
MDKRRAEKSIEDLAGIFTDPIIVFPGGWGDSLPDWLRQAITLERLLAEVESLKGNPPTAADTEVCAYLMTVSLTQAIDSDWTQIYIYLAGKVVRRHKRAEMPEDLNVESISEYQKQELRRLKDWLYLQRTRNHLDRSREERR